MSIQQTILDFTDHLAEKLIEDLHMDHLHLWPTHDVVSRLLVQQDEFGTDEAPEEAANTSAPAAEEEPAGEEKKEQPAAQGPPPQSEEDAAAEAEARANGDCAKYNKEIEKCVCYVQDEEGKCLDKRSEIDFGELTWEEWVLFLVGLSVGAALSNTTGLGNMCMIALLKIVNALYYLAVFIKEYAETQELWRLSFAGLKVLQLVQIALTMECGDYLTTLNEWWGVIFTSVGLSDETVGSAMGSLDGILDGLGILAPSGGAQAGDGGETEPAATRRLLLGDPMNIKQFKGPIVQATDAEKAEAAANAAKAYAALKAKQASQAEAQASNLKTDAMGNIFPSQTTEVSTASFEWLYTVLKGGQSVVALAELGVDSEQVYEAWINERYYDAGNFIGQASFVVVDEVVDLWNTYIAQFFEDKENATLKIGTKYGPVAVAGNRSESALFINSLLDKAVDVIETTIPEEALGISQSQADSMNANEILPSANPCVRQTITLDSTEILKLKIEPGSTAVVKTKTAMGMFNNSDVNRCPYASLELYDSAGESLPAEIQELIKIDKDCGSFHCPIEIYQEKFTLGFEPLAIKVGLLTGFGEFVYKQILLTEKTQCEISREMKMKANSKCTIDEENDQTNINRAQECSTINDCWDGGYKNSNCPDDHHCSNWTKSNGNLYAGCILSKMCFQRVEYSGDSVVINCVNDIGRDAPVAVPVGYKPPSECVDESAA